MSRVHDRLKQKKSGRRPARATQSTVPSVLVNDTRQAEAARPDARSTLQAIRETETRLKNGILALQQDNVRLRKENQELRKRLGER